MNCICEFCKIEFESKNNRRFCSRTCINKFRWSDKTFRDNLTKKLKEVHNSDSVKEKHSKASLRNWENCEFRNNVVALLNSVDVKERKNESFKNVLKDPTIKEKYSLSKKKMWEDPEYRLKQVNIIKERWSDPEYRKNESEKMKSRWANPEYAEKHLKSLYKYKDYTLPSGKMIKLQGYEPQVLFKLLETYSEDDIVTGVKEMNAAIGKINYVENNVERSYYPDFYIKSTNTIIEVKSKWTYEKWKERNELKKQACLSLGFNFKFIIYTN